jgi:hypothetical protein
MKKGMIVILLCLLLAACSASEPSAPQDFMDEVASTNLSAEEVGGIVLGDSKQALKVKRDQPSGRFDVLMKGADQYDAPIQSWEYEDVSYTVSQDRIMSYSLKTADTAKGIQLGNSIESVKDKYGDGFYNRENSDLEVIGYMDKEKEWVSEFIIDQEKVAGIMMSEWSLFISNK